MSGPVQSGRPSAGAHGSPRAVLMLLFALCLCAPARAAGPSDQRGFVREGVAGRLLFQRCAAARPAEQWLALNDGTPDRALLAGIEQVRQVTQDGGDGERALYVEFNGELTGTLMEVRRFQRVIGHVADCAAAPAAMPASVRLHAEGGLPAWRLRVTPTGTKLEEPGAKPVRFTTLTAAAGASPRRYKAMPLSGGTTMQVELTEQPCLDDRSETAYAARVVVQIGERRLEGCAARF